MEFTEHIPLNTISMKKIKEYIQKADKQFEISVSVKLLDLIEIGKGNIHIGDGEVNSAKLRIYLDDEHTIIFDLFDGGLTHNGLPITQKQFDMDMNEVFDLFSDKNIVYVGHHSSVTNKKRKMLPLYQKFIKELKNI